MALAGVHSLYKEAGGAVHVNQEACFWSLMVFRARVVSVWCEHKEVSGDPGILPSHHRVITRCCGGCYPVLSVQQQSARTCAVRKYNTSARATRSAGPSMRNRV